VHFYPLEAAPGWAGIRAQRNRPEIADAS